MSDESKYAIYITFVCFLIGLLGCLIWFGGYTSGFDDAKFMNKVCEATIKELINDKR